MTPIDVPDWMARSVDAYYEHVAEMVCAFVVRYGRVPIVIQAHGRLEMRACCDVRFVLPEAVEDAFVEACRAKADAWATLTHGMAADGAFVTCTCRASGVTVSVTEREFELGDEVTREAAEHLARHRWVG